MVQIGQYQLLCLLVHMNNIVWADNDAIFAGGRNIEVGGNTSINCSQTFDGSVYEVLTLLPQRFADSW